MKANSDFKANWKSAVQIVCSRSFKVPIISWKEFTKSFSIATSVIWLLKRAKTKHMKSNFCFVMVNLATNRVHWSVSEDCLPFVLFRKPRRIFTGVADHQNQIKVQKQLPPSW